MGKKIQHPKVYILEKINHVEEKLEEIARFKKLDKAREKMREIGNFVSLYGRFYDKDNMMLFILEYTSFDGGITDIYTAEYYI